MYLTVRQKKEIFNKFGKYDSNTGYSECKIAMFTYRIKHITEHLHFHKSDLNTIKSLLKLVGKRKRLLNSLQSSRYIIKELLLIK